MRRALLTVPFLLAPTLLAGPGADLIVGDINGVAHFTTSGAVNGRRAFALGVTWCNLGDLPAGWTINNTNHPVAVQNLHRISQGRIEQIGQSWAHHQFSALQQALCSSCTPTAGTTLGVGCSTPSTASILGSQTVLSSRAEINAPTGSPTIPSPTMNTSGDALFKRLQALESDLTTPGAQYFAEVLTLHPADAAANNSNNNSSYRPLLINPTTFSMTFSGAAERASTILDAWKANANGAGAPDPFIRITPIDIADDGRILVGSRAHQVSPGVWRYTYAILNLNSDRGLASVIIPRPASSSVSNTTFNAPEHHSGEPYSNTPWPAQITPAAVAWSTETFAANPNANAIRWGTLYTFSFHCDAPPVYSTAATLYPFKPGGPTGVHNPALIAPGPHFCAGDANGDNLVNFTDINFILSNFGAEGVALPGDVNADGVVNFADLNLTLSNYALSC